MKKIFKKGFFLFFTFTISTAIFAQNTVITASSVANSKTDYKVTPDLEDTYKSYFEKRKSAMFYLKNLQLSTDFLFYAKKFSKQDFLEKKNEYHTKGGSDAYVYELINKQEEFYTSILPTETTETINAFLELQNAKKDYVKHSAKEALNAYNLCLEYIDGMLLLSPEDSYYKDLKTKNENQKKELEAYISSGEYEKKLNDRTQDQKDAVQLNTSQMTDIYAEWATSEGLLTANLGTVAAVAITSKQWKIKKDASGIPLFKYVDVEATTKPVNGKCYKVTGTVTKAYEKEATYGKPLFKYEYKEEMNCEKANK